MHKTKGMGKHLMSTYTPKLLDCCVRNGVVETAAVGMGKNDRYFHYSKIYQSGLEFKARNLDRETM